jgi:hypothetical protein
MASREELISGSRVAGVFVRSIPAVVLPFHDDDLIMRFATNVSSGERQ